jgi:hypothetical protein
MIMNSMIERPERNISEIVSEGGVKTTVFTGF